MRIAVVLGLIVIVSVVVGYYAIDADPGMAPVQSPDPDGAHVAQVTKSIGDEHVRDNRFVGVLFTHLEVDLAPKIQGVLANVYVELGDRFEAHDLIASLEVEVVRQEVVIAEAALRASQAEHQKSEALLLEAIARREKRELSLGDFATEEVYDAVLSEKVAVAQVEVSRSRVDQEKARVAILKRQMEDSNIKAPFAGAVAIRYRGPGSIVAPGVPIVRLISTEDLWVRIAVPESQSDKLKMGVEISIRNDELDIETTGVIKNIAPEVDSATRMVIAEAELDKRAQRMSRLRPGMVVGVTLVDRVTMHKTIPSGMLARP